MWHLVFAGITSVSVAAHKGRQQIVKMLIAAQADVNIDSNNGSTPLIQASHFGGCACSPAYTSLPTVDVHSVSSRLFLFLVFSAPGVPFCLRLIRLVLIHRMAGTASNPLGQDLHQVFHFAVVTVFYLFVERELLCPSER